jgi:hypothetical protein
MGGDLTETFTTSIYPIPRKGERIFLKSGCVTCEFDILDVVYDFKKNIVLVKVNVDNSLQYKWEI